MGVDGYWHGFYFDDHERMAEVVQQLDQDPRIQSVYYVFNEIDPKIDVPKNPDAAEIERIISGPSQRLTKNKDILKRRWLFIDVDTVRAEGHDGDSSTKEEKAACREVWLQVQAYLESKGWPAPLVADSGNGYHILVRIDQPDTPTITAYIEDCLKTLDKKFSCAAAHVDPMVFNAARITRAYGTHTRKGNETPDRPFRRNRLKEPKERLRLVTFDQIVALADEGPKTSKINRGDMPLLHENFDPNDFFEWYEQQGAFEITSTKAWESHTVAITDHCIISGTKHTGSVLTGFIIGDSFGYHCWSPECNNPNIGDVLRKLHEDGYKRYPKKIWVEEPLLLNFEKNQEEFVKILEEEGERYRPPNGRTEPTLGKNAEDFSTSLGDPLDNLLAKIPPSENFEDEAEAVVEEPESIVDKLDERVEAQKAAEAADEGVTPPPKPKKDKPIRINDALPNQYAEYLMGIVFRDPKKAVTDYGFFRKRFQGISRNLGDVMREAFGGMVHFEQVNKYLPSKAELIDHIKNSEDTKNTPYKKEACDLINSIEDDGTHFFDTTAKRLIAEMDEYVERDIVRKAFNAYLRDKEAVNVEAFRTALRKHWAAHIGYNSNFKPGTWQENADQLLEAFRRDVSGEGDERKFKLGFESIDELAGNIGLDSNHAIVIYGPANNRKTNFAMTIALNFAMQGKRGLFLAGEHLREKIEKRLTLMLSYYLRKDENNPDGIVPVIPNLTAWEGSKRTATYDDLANVALVLNELKTMSVVPGFLEVQNIDSITRGEEDALGAIMNYIDSGDKKYQWDFVIIDPLDTILPTDTGDKSGGQFNAAAAVVDRLFDYSRNFRGDTGLMIIVTAQFKSDVRRDIEKIQAKNGGVEDFDDEIVAILRRDSNIQYIGNKLTQRFDLALGVALRVKDGQEGIIVQGRSREGGTFDVMPFRIDPESNLMLENKGTVTRRVGDREEAPAHEDHSPYDTL